MTTTFTVNQMAEDWQQANMTFAAYAASKHVPLGGTFELTPRCSLKCKMCYVRLDPAQMDAIGRELTAREWISLASDAIKAGTVNLLITGGEPLIRPDFAEIYSALSQMGFIITLNTMPRLLHLKSCACLKNIPRRKLPSLYMVPVRKRTKKSAATAAGLKKQSEAWKCLQSCRPNSRSVRRLLRTT
jgi:uncharacterized radical SAM superfamily Fe-S cluster-containing enzyme